MGRPKNASRQTRRLLGALSEHPGEWRYGYELSRLTGLQSGTLYPLLMRLHDEGVLAAEWREPNATGRPPRHVYRLTAAGALLAQEIAEREPTPARVLRARPA